MNRFLLIAIFFAFFVSNTQAQEATEDWVSLQDNVFSYSSPRALDLTGDGIKDIVVGAGRENQATNNGIFAVDGSNGETLWTVPTRNQIYASPVFQDINNDGVADIFIGGREAEFYAVSGASGEVLWEFFPQADTVNPVDSGWYNFYSPQWLPDQDGDGLQDLLLANGGDYSATILTEDRPQGNILVVSSADGSVIAKAGVPDEKETYMSPLVADFYNNGNLYIIFGTGGENDFNSGHIYKAPLTALLNNDLSEAEIVIESPEKGFIAPPSLVDLNDDSVLDIIVNAYDGKVIAVDGLTNQYLWEATIEGGETNASPAIGHFNDDNVPDVFSTYAIGLAPTFTDFRQVMIDGATGEIQYNESVGFFQFNSPSVADLDQDGFDEVIMSTNAIDFQTFDATHEVRIFDFNDNTNEIIYGTLPGLNVNSTGLLENIDNDGNLDFIYLHSEEPQIGNTDAGLLLKKLSLSTPDDIEIPWGGYLGTTYNSEYKNLKEPCDESEYDFEVTTTPIACGGLGSASIATNMCNGDCEFIWLSENLQFISSGETVEDLEEGTYFLNIVNFDECNYYRQVIIEATEAGVDLNTQATNATACDANDGSVYIQFETGTPPYITNFNGAMSSPTNVAVYLQNNLSAGTYEFSVTDALGCTTQETIIIEPIPLEVNYTEQCENGICAFQLGISGGSGNYTATINNEEITNNNFIITETGTYSLLVEDENGCSYAEELEIIVTSINDLSEKNIRWEQKAEQLSIISEELISNWQLFSIEGKLISFSKISAKAHEISLESLSNGIYFIKIEINNKIFTRKLCKK